VVPCPAPAGYPAFQICQGFAQHRATASWVIDCQPVNAGSFRLEAAAEVDDHVGLAVIENVQRETGAIRKPVQQFTALLIATLYAEGRRTLLDASLPTCRSRHRPDVR